MKLLLFPCLFLSLVTVCQGQGQRRLLESAYKAHSTEQLDSFFERWSREIPPFPAIEINRLSDTAHNIYELFRAFYNPLDIGKIGGSEWGNDIYKKVNYVLVQDVIGFGFVERLEKDSLQDGRDWPRAKKLDTIRDFHPFVSFSSPKTVVLSDRYQTLLNNFLGSSFTPLGKKNIMSPAKAMGESQKRQEFLQRAIKVWYGHWGGYWQLYSYPAVTFITFDRTMQRAVIDYRLVYKGGFAYFKKVNGKWVLQNAGRTWIE